MNKKEFHHDTASICWDLVKDEVKCKKQDTRTKTLNKNFSSRFSISVSKLVSWLHCTHNTTASSVNVLRSLIYFKLQRAMLYRLTCLTGSSQVMLLLMMVICQGNDNIWQDETLGKLINPPSSSILIARYY